MASTITIYPSSGEGNGSVNVEASANDGYVDYGRNITVKGVKSGITRTIHVSVKGKLPSAYWDPSTYTFKLGDRQAFTLVADSNLQFNVHITGDSAFYFTGGMSSLIIHGGDSVYVEYSKNSGIITYGTLIAETMGYTAASASLIGN